MIFVYVVVSVQKLETCDFRPAILQEYVKTDYVACLKKSPFTYRYKSFTCSKNKANDWNSAGNVSKTILSVALK